MEAFYDEFYDKDPEEAIDELYDADEFYEEEPEEDDLEVDEVFDEVEEEEPHVSYRCPKHDKILENETIMICKFCLKLGKIQEVAPC